MAHTGKLRAGMIHRGDNFRVQVPGAGMKSSVPVSPPKITRNLQLPTISTIISEVMAYCTNWRAPFFFDWPPS